MFCCEKSFARDHTLSTARGVLVAPRKTAGLRGGSALRQKIHDEKCDSGLTGQYAKRHKLGVSQEAFADLCGLDRPHIGGIERGERNVALVNIEKITRALRLSLPELMRGV
jgi:DNA-binding XRE family transcriptional regulator